MRRFAPWITLCFFTTVCPFACFAQGQTQPPAHKPAATSTHRRTTHMTTDPALLQPATLHAKAPDVYDVKFSTTRGDFVVQVTRAWAPLGADRFYNLVKHGFYIDAGFFRIVPGFVVQFGLSANPAVNKAWQQANIKDDPVLQSNRPGYVTFAHAGPNTRTTQVFINLGNNAQLDSMGFPPFGQVTSGMDVVQALYSGYGEKPDQGMITSQGKVYLDKNFPKLDSIKSATIESPAAAPKP
jgi:peptidyl-prolyl cis-trans isomerase A (cyclophilin A)